jgi:hypothetical protein
MAVRAKRRDSVALPSPCVAQQSRKALRPLSEFAVREAAHAVNDGSALGKYFRGAIKKLRWI